MDNGISCTKAIVEGQDFVSGMKSSMQAMKASFFTPNSIFLSLTDDQTDDDEYQVLIASSRRLGYGAYLYVPYGKVGLGLEKTIDIWIDAKDISEMDATKPKHINLALLTGYLLQRNWKALFRINVLLDEVEEQSEVEELINQVKILARLPKSTVYKYWKGGIAEAFKSLRGGDLSIRYLKPEDVDIKALRRKTALLEASVLYTIDSDIENAFA